MPWRAYIHERSGLGRWYADVRRVQRHPWVLTGAVAAGLLIVAIPLLLLALAGVAALIVGAVVYSLLNALAKVIDLLTGGGGGIDRGTGEGDMPGVGTSGGGVSGGGVSGGGRVNVRVIEPDERG